MVGRRLCCALVAALLLVVSAGEGAGAQAQAPVISVTPNTDLVAGQLVTVTGSGWATTAWVAAGQCPASAEGITDTSVLQSICDSINISISVAPDGTITFDLRVRRLLPSTDCATEACIILVMDLNTLVQAAAPLQFRPGTLPTPEVSVMPQTELSDTDVVTVAGEGFVPGFSVTLTQCEDEARGITDIFELATYCGVTESVVPAADGSFTIDYTVARTRPAVRTTDTVTCGEAPSDCLILVWHGDDFLYEPITFASSQLPKAVPGGATVTEGDAGSVVVSIPVTLSSASEQEVTIEWQTIFDPAWSEIAAVPGVDYTTASGQLVFEPGDVEEHAQIVITPDVNAELDELLVVSFNQPTNARMGGFWGLGFGGIQNDD